MSQSLRSIDFSAGRRAIVERPQRAVAAQAVADQLFVSERAVDVAAGEISKLFTTFIEARRKAGLSTTVGHELLNDATEAQSALVVALEKVTALHGRGLALTRELGLPRMDFGDGGVKPDS